MFSMRKWRCLPYRVGTNENLLYLLKVNFEQFSLGTYSLDTLWYSSRSSSRSLSVPNTSFSSCLYHHIHCIINYRSSILGRAGRNGRSAAIVAGCRITRISFLLAKLFWTVLTLHSFNRVCAEAINIDHNACTHLRFEAMLHAPTSSKRIWAI